MLSNMVRAELHRLSKTPAPYIYLGIEVAMMLVSTALTVYRLDMGRDWEVGPGAFSMYHFIQLSILLAGVFVCNFVLSGFADGFIVEILQGPHARGAYVATCFLFSVVACAAFVTVGWAACTVVLLASGGPFPPVPVTDVLLYLLQAFAYSAALVGGALFAGFLTLSPTVSTVVLIAAVYGLPSSLTATLLGAARMVERGFRFNGTPGTMIAELTQGPLSGWLWLVETVLIAVVSWTATAIVMRRRPLG